MNRIMFRADYCSHYRKELFMGLSEELLGFIYKNAYKESLPTYQEL